MFTFLVFKDSFSEQELQTKAIKYVLKKKLFFIRLFQNCSLKKLLPQKNTFSKIINLIALIDSSSDSSEKEKSLKLSLTYLTSFFSN